MVVRRVLSNIPEFSVCKLLRHFNWHFSHIHRRPTHVDHLHAYIDRCKQKMQYKPVLVNMAPV